MEIMNYIVKMGIFLYNLVVFTKIRRHFNEMKENIHNMIILFYFPMIISTILGISFIGRFIIDLEGVFNYLRISPGLISFLMFRLMRMEN